MKSFNFLSYLHINVGLDINDLNKTENFVKRLPNAEEILCL